MACPQDNSLLRRVAGAVDLYVVRIVSLPIVNEYGTCRPALTKGLHWIPGRGKTSTKMIHTMASSLTGSSLRLRRQRIVIDEEQSRFDNYLRAGIFDCDHCFHHIHQYQQRKRQGKSNRSPCVPLSLFMALATTLTWRRRAVSTREPVCFAFPRPSRRLASLSLVLEVTATAAYAAKIGTARGERARPRVVTPLEEGATETPTSTPC